MSPTTLACAMLAPVVGTLEEARMDVRRMPDGARCELCGELVTGKELIPGEIEPCSDAEFRRLSHDRLGANQPCGHYALAIVRGDTPSFPQ